MGRFSVKLAARTWHIGVGRWVFLLGPGLLIGAMLVWWSVDIAKNIQYQPKKLHSKKKWFLEHSRRISGEKAWMYVRVEDRGLESKRLVACCSHVRTKCHELSLNLEDFLPGEMVSHSAWRITGATQNSLRHTQAWSLIVSSLLRFKISNRHVHFALTTLGIRPWVFRCRIHFHSSKDNTDWVWALWQRIAADLVGAVS